MSTLYFIRLINYAQKYPPKACCSYFCCTPRHVLGEMEWNKRNFQRACRHYAMGARAGHSGCLSDLQDGVKIGAFDRDEYKRVLQDYKNAVEESRSKLRENSPLKQLMSLLG